MKIQGYNERQSPAASVTSVVSEPPQILPAIPASIPDQEHVVQQAAKDKSTAPKTQSSFRLKEALSVLPAIDTNKTEDKDTLELSDSLRQPVDINTVSEVLRFYVQNVNNEPFVVAGIVSHPPLVEHENITIRVDNQLQLDKLESVKSSLLHFLKKELSNTYLSLSFVMSDPDNGMNRKKFVTAQDKLEYFIKQNPVVEEMRKLLGLEIE